VVTDIWSVASIQSFKCGKQSITADWTRSKSDFSGSLLNALSCGSHVILSGFDFDSIIPERNQEISRISNIDNTFFKLIESYCLLSTINCFYLRKRRMRKKFPRTCKILRFLWNFPRFLWESLSLLKFLWDSSGFKWEMIKFLWDLLRLLEF